MTMEVVHQKIQQLQGRVDTMGCGHLGIAAAGALMLFVACPMSVVAVASPYWTGSEETLGATISSSASLWTVSTIAEGNGASTEQDADMCGDANSLNADCGKIDAVRFFTVTTLLLALASAVVLLVAFSPATKEKPELRSKLCFVGAFLTGVTLLWNFLSVCVAASVEMPDSYSLNGAGFAFLILSLLLIIGAIALTVFAVRRSSLAPVAAMARELEQLQGRVDAVGCGHLCVAAAGALMLFVACPISIIAIASPYWTGSEVANGATISSSASLWTVSIITEGNGASSEQDTDMCGDATQNNDVDCGKIDAVRFFTVTALLVALASSVVLLVAFSPATKEKVELRSKLCLAGACLSVVTFLWNFLGLCLVASVEMPEPYGLNGAGFAFLILSLLLIIGAVSLALLVARRWSPTSIVTVGTTIASIGKPQSSAAIEPPKEVKVVETMPNLLKVVPAGMKPASKEAANHNSIEAADKVPEV